MYRKKLKQEWSDLALRQNPFLWVVIRPILGALETNEINDSITRMRWAKRNTPVVESIPPKNVGNVTNKTITETT